MNSQNIMTEAKKGKGIEEVLRGLFPGVVEEQPAVQRTGYNAYDPLLQKYEHIYRECLAAKGLEALGGVCVFIKNEVTEKLASPDINLFLQMSAIYAEHHLYDQSMGMFINQLLYNANAEGHNYFTLDTRIGGPLSFIGGGLRGSHNQHIQLVVLGHLGLGCGSYMEYVDLQVNGMVGYGFSGNSTHCLFSFDDIWEERPGFSPAAGQERKPTHGGENENCTYIVRSKECAEMLARTLRRQHACQRGNRVIYRQNNQDIIIKDFDPVDQSDHAHHY